LTSLEHCPTTVTGVFYCYNNKLISLKCPTTVTGDFNCSHNLLTTLEHCPTTVKGHFYCSNNRLTTLEHCPTTVTGDFNCSHNLLTSLEHCPTTVDGDFSCNNNRLTSLEHCPKTVKGEFYLFINKFPKEIKKKIENFEGTWKELVVMKNIWTSKKLNNLNKKLDYLKYLKTFKSKSPEPFKKVFKCKNVVDATNFIKRIMYLAEKDDHHYKIYQHHQMMFMK
jgi:pterin-4a-carbinolamine dehydratase